MEVDGRLSLEERPPGLLGLGADLHNWGNGGLDPKWSYGPLQDVQVGTGD